MDRQDSSLVRRSALADALARCEQAELGLADLAQQLADTRCALAAANRQLEEADQRQAVTLASIGAGFMATDAQGRVTRMNAVAEAVTGWTEAEAVGCSLWQVFLREDRPADLVVLNPVAVMQAQGITVEQVHHVVAIARDGRRTPLEVQAALTRAADGLPQGLAMVFRDRSSLDRAALEQQQLAAIVESSYDAIIGKTLDGRITSWNAAAAALFGYSAAEAIGMPVQRLMPAEREAEEMAILADLAQGRRVAPFDTVRQARDGRRIEVMVTVSPIRDALGRIVGASKTVRDVRQQRLAEVARRQAERLEAENRQVLEASRLKSQFLANMSHELRTPLNAIIGFADLLQAGAVPAGSPRQAEFLGHIGTSGRHLLQLINDVLDLSKVESGKFEFLPEPLDLPRLLDEVSGVLHTALQRKHLALTVDVDPALDPLVLDPARLKQALFNFLSNAIKFTPERGRITVRARAEGASQLRIEVEDSGIGIAPADLGRLFVEFQQLDGGYGKQHAGTGLGLALTRRLVMAQGGQVGVHSQPGVGSVFHLVLPRVHAPAAALPGQRLLVIEPAGPPQRQLVQGLSAAGYTVDAAATGEQARVRATDQAYDAITLGLLLPDQGGFGALAGIRSDGASRQSPVLALTLPGPADQAARFAVANVLCKPIRADEVAAAMARLPWPVGRAPRVLVIDDELAAVDLMRATLQALGLHAVGVTDGRLALRELDRHQPDAIVLDLMMPGFDGFETLDALRRLPAWRDTPVFIWTSLILSDAEYARLAGSARAILGKGGGALAELLDTLSRWRPPVPAAVGLP